MRLLFKLILAVLPITLIAQSAHAAKIYRQFHYYSVSGNTAAELDRALARNGPYLKSTGSHHPGATRIRFVPDIKLGKTGKYCKVIKANVDVHATISLPHWKQRNSASSTELAIIWDVLSQDIKRHEESHIVIARTHATEIEHRLRTFSYRHDCADLQKDVDKVVSNILADHDREQARFDRVEAVNFEKRFTRLLTYKIEKLVIVPSR